MNKSMLTGIIAGVGIATAGGVAGYALLGQPTAVDEQGSALVIEDPIEAPALGGHEAEVAPAPVATTQAAPVPTRAAPTATAARTQSAPQPTAAANPAPTPVAEECWDEEVTVQVDPRDDRAIAGTAAGAVIGGAIAKKVGDDNDLATAAGAAAGAFFGRRAQRRMQENNTTTTIERRCAPVGSR